MLVLASQCTVHWPLNDSSLADEAFSALQQHAAVWSLISATAMLAVQGGLMGSRMVRCIFAKHLVGCFANAVWWRLVMANCSRPRNVDRRPYATARNMPRLLFMLTTAQFILLAGVRACDVE